MKKLYVSGSLESVKTPFISPTPYRAQQMLKVPGHRQQASRCNLERVYISVGYRAHEVTGSDIYLGAALDGLRGPKASAGSHEWKCMPEKYPGLSKK
jgi:hypothetical protein